MNKDRAPPMLSTPSNIILTIPEFQNLEATAFLFYNTKRSCMNNGQMHLFEQSHIHAISKIDQTCESMYVTEVQQVQIIVTGHCDPMDICPSGEAN